MGENMYIATITSRITSTDSIVKDVTKKLNKTPNLTIEQLINYLIKDDGTFNEEERDIINEIEDNIQICKESESYRTRLVIKALNESGEYRTFPTNDNNKRIRDLINHTEIAKDYFEPRKFDGTSYKELALEVYARG